MPDQQENAELKWVDGVLPVSTRFDDPYYSFENGMEESQHVFLAGNKLPDRFGPGFHIGELGFGTGLNLLCAWKSWSEAGHLTPLRFTSFEAFPMSVQHMAKAQSAWPTLIPFSRLFQLHWNNQTQALDTETLSLRVISGDARQTLPRWAGKFDAWFLDGFSPAKNPELWGADLMAHVAQHTNPDGTFATYTAAGHVRQSLATAGFEVTRVPGFGRKRHMSIGTLKME